jgi:hypothetical protein
MLGATPVSVGDFTWETELTFARNRNEVLSIGDVDEGVNIPGFGTTSIYVGSPIGIQRIPTWVGIDPATGQNIYQDLTGAQVLESEAIASHGSVNNFLRANQSPFGNPWPDMTGGIFNRVTWKNLYAQVFFTYEYGANYISGEMISSKYAFNAFNINPFRRQLNRWRNPGDITDIAQLNTNPTIWTRTTEYAFDVDYLRMKDLTVGYILRPDMAAIQSINVYAKMTNYLTITNAPDHVWDPEIWRSAGNLNQMNKWRTQPQAKMIILGLNVTF